MYHRVLGKYFVQYKKGSDLIGSEEIDNVKDQLLLCNTFAKKQMFILRNFYLGSGPEEQRGNFLPSVGQNIRTNIHPIPPDSSPPPGPTFPQVPGP